MQLGNSFGFISGIIGGMNPSEVYPGAPIAMVILEIRHPIAANLTLAERLALKEALAEHAPILRNVEVLEASLGGGEPRSQRYPKLVSRDKHLNISFRGDAVVIEATKYYGYEWFRRVIAAVLSVRLDVAQVDGLERIGMRYVDELRVDGSPENEVDWERWVSHDLLGPRSVSKGLGMKPQMSHGLTVFSMEEEGRNLALRYGALSGKAVESNEDLLRPSDEEGPFFLFDIDSSWASIDRIPEFDPQNILALVDELHKPVRQLFELLVTDNYREEVLRNGKTD